MVMSLLRLSLLCCVLFAGWPVPSAIAAIEPDEVLQDPALEARARALTAQLRCVVCQNQALDDSDAPLAKDLRVLVRERIVAGDSDDEVMDFLVARYGEFVLLQPRFGAHTLILWLGPVALALGLAGVVAWRIHASRRATGVAEGAPAPAGNAAGAAQAAASTANGSRDSMLSAQEQAELEAVLQDYGGPDANHGANKNSR